MGDAAGPGLSSRARLRAAVSAPARLAPAVEAPTARLPLARRRDLAPSASGPARTAASAAAAQLCAPEARLCTVCLAQPRSVVFTACGHLLLCGECLERVMLAEAPKCPLCRTAVLPDAWTPLAAATALAPTATYMPSMVDVAVAAAARAVRKSDDYIIPNREEELALLREAVQRGETPPDSLLLRAAELGAVDLVRLLVEGGANVACVNSRFLDATPLHCAAHHGHADCVRLLVELGAEVACKSTDGITPLHCANYEGRAECVRVLVELGADVACESNTGMTPLDWAADKGHADCVRVLVELGADGGTH